MKRLIVLITCLVSGISIAQNFHTDNTDTTFYGLITDGDFDVKFLLHNDSSGAFPMSWEVTSTNVVNGWDYSVCDPSNCYAVGTTSGTFNIPTTTSNRIMNLHYYPNGIYGQSQVTVKVWENEFPSNPVYLTWTGIVENTAGIESENNLNEITVFPNPSSDNISINYNINQITQSTFITITSMNGSVVKSEKLNSTQGQLTINNLESGIYIYQLTIDGIPSLSNRIVIL